MLIKATSSVQISSFPYSDIFYVKTNILDLKIEPGEIREISLNIFIDDNFVEKKFSAQKSKISIFFSLPMEYRLKGLSIQKNPLPYSLNAISIEVKNLGHECIEINDDFLCGIGITFL